ncbi:MAG TPA: ester cyclase [Acidobacteriaceae bacterium]|nr:ester cyclase [Acidobacteriaceae bacterium]
MLDPAGFKHRSRRSRAAFPDQRFDIQGLYADGDAIGITWFWQATHRGDIPGYSATGKIIRMSGATAYFFDSEDRLTGHWQITDRLGVFQQLERNKAAST